MQLFEEIPHDLKKTPSLIIATDGLHEPTHVPLRRAASVIILLSLLQACASTPQRIAYTSINGAVDAVQTALTAWNENFYSPGVKVDPVKWNAARDKVQAAYVKFQASAQLATTLAQDITQKDNAVKVASDAAAEAIALIQALSGGK